MQEEIFGPILPVIAYRDRNEMIDTVKRRPKPLALYLFSTDKLFTEQVTVSYTHLDVYKRQSGAWL